MSIYLDGMDLTEEQRQENYINNCRKDASIKRDVLQCLKNQKANIISDIRINSNKVLKDIAAVYLALSANGFNVELDGQTVWLRDMSCGYITKCYDRNKVYFRLWC